MLLKMKSLKILRSGTKVYCAHDDCLSPPKFI